MCQKTAILYSGCSFEQANLGPSIFAGRSEIQADFSVRPKAVAFACTPW
jgi:hypothetical protein